jgi:hypothetical protein
MALNPDIPPSSTLAFLDMRKVPPPESAKAARAYADYEAMADRSLAKLAVQYNRPPSYVRQLARWSEAYNWQQRIKDYERAQLEERRKRRQKEQEDMDKRHADYGRAALYEAIKFINDHLYDEEIIINREGKPEKRPRTTISQAVSLMRTSYELERLARGAATERIEGDMSITVLPKEYINLSEDEEGSEP